MGFLDFLFGDKGTNRLNESGLTTSTEISPYSPQAVPYGLNKPASECSVEDLKTSQKKVWENHQEALEGFHWKLVAGVDYKTTLTELALHGVSAESPE